MNPYWLDELLESCELEEGDVVLDGLLLLRVARADDKLGDSGAVALAMGRTKGCDWIMQAGLLSAGHMVFTSDGIEHP